MQLYHTNKPPFFLFDKHFRKWQGVNNKLAIDASSPNLPNLLLRRTIVRKDLDRDRVVFLG